MTAVAGGAVVVADEVEYFLSALLLMMMMLMLPLLLLLLMMLLLMMPAVPKGKGCCNATTFRVAINTTTISTDLRWLTPPVLDDVLACRIARDVGQVIHP